jgi:Protein of unknown function (DUF2510)
VWSSSIARMQEFSSVTASSYDADALAPLLSEKSADGWDVVSIVSAGTNIVAYLRRETSGDTATDESDDTAFVPVPVEEPAAEQPVEEAPAEEPAVEPVDEPAGWGTAPETTESEPEPVVAEEPVVAPVAEEPAAAAAAPVESAVPAGWYADPSGRYELRYWDGNAWTEHVSRAGQQFTDPPVA